MLAITLARRNFREADQQITFYTKDLGKLSAVARGIKRIVSKNAPTLEPFSLLEVEIVPGKNHPYVTKVQLMESFLSIRKDLNKMLVAGFALELVRRVVKDNERDANIFKLIYSFEKYLHRSRSVSELLAAAFVGRLSCFLGFTPLFASCVSCSKKLPKPVYFSVSGGGVVCEKCVTEKHLDAYKTSTAAIKLFHTLLTNEWGKLKSNFPAKEIAEAVRILCDHAGYHFGFEIKLPIMSKG